MPEEVLNLIIIAVPLAIFIGRIVVNARNKRNPPPKPAQPHIPVHFEDEDDGYFRKRATASTTPVKATAVKPRVHTAPTLSATPTKSAMPTKSAPPAPGRNAVGAAASGQFTFNLNHLSALKQAVVMAEILGPPKGME